MRILVAVHGYEPPNWARELPGVLPLSPGTAVRVLGVIDVPTPGFTSLTPCARRAYRAALAAWREKEETRIRASLDTLVQALPRGVEPVWAQAARQGPARAIVEHATAWLADLLVVGRDTRPRLKRVVLGSIHRMVVRDAPCGVLVWPRCEVEATRSGRVLLRPA
jgi:nucleotide-binding universal stress UspA family protein